MADGEPPAKRRRKEHAQFRFLQLPTEIRLKIYETHFETFELDPSLQTWRFSATKPAMLGVCKQIRHEAMQSYYARLHATIDKAEADIEASLELGSNLRQEADEDMGSTEVRDKFLDHLADVVEVLDDAIRFMWMILGFQRRQMMKEGFPVAMWEEIFDSNQ